ncbi:serine/threonine-protein kinase [Actinomadura litoris]|uniref:serine/threonine-protein kinase n=1 Tax=Actinomadura litoris TaxID=2678616 RepID=UPI001FA7BB7B|nr:serine/threonine-protein kinase [Actinomadura litoris]
MTGGEADDRELKGLLGRVIDGRYELREFIGGGAFGAVFRAQQRLLGVPVRQVAVKLSRRGGLTEEIARDQFADALLLAGALEEMTDAEARDHLVAVYDAGVALEAGRRGFLVMEHVRGRTLGEEFAAFGTGVPAASLIRWGRQICLALRGLHGLVPALLHRDLKPDNVLVDGLTGRARVVDFGLAARLIERGHAPGAAGALHYMAPETLKGESVPASDLYAVGIILYEGLTGKHPYGHLHPPDRVPVALHGDWLQEARLTCVVPPPSALNYTVGPSLDDLVLRCLDPDPRRRFASAGELLRALEGAERPAAPRASTPAQQVARLLEQADAQLAAGEGGAAVRSCLDAWEVVERHPAALRSRRERADLAARTARAYELDGNGFQAARFRRRRDAELNGGR